MSNRVLEDLVARIEALEKKFHQLNAAIGKLEMEKGKSPHWEKTPVLVTSVQDHG